MATRHSPTTRSRWPHRLVLAAVAFLVLGVSFATGVGQPDIAHAATVEVNQCNYDVLMDAGAASEIWCDVSVENTYDVGTGDQTSIVTTRICAGAPGAVTTADCVTTSAETTDIVGSVNQCNNTSNAGGSTIHCSVTVVNYLTGTGSTTPATVNQCVNAGEGGGTQPTAICSPVESTTNADVTQCNTAGNGGGGSGRVICTVDTSTVSSLWPVTVNQCNDSANGGGDTVICSAQITSILVDTTTTAVPESTTTTAPPSETTAPPTDTTPAPPSATTPESPIATTTPFTPTDITLPRTGSEVPTTMFNPTDITLPRTGASLTSQSGIGFVFVLIGLAALVIARRRQPA